MYQGEMIFYDQHSVIEVEIIYITVSRKLVKNKHCPAVMAP